MCTVIRNIMLQMWNLINKSFDDSTRYDLTIHETILEIANYIDKEQIDFTCSAIFLEVISYVVAIS